MKVKAGMMKGNIIELRIEDMLDDGRAFGRSDGLAVFVSGGCETGEGEHVAGAVPGDLLRVEITKEKKKSAEARPVEMIEASGDRVKAECEYFGICGGCSLQELSYDAQLRLKTRQLRDKLGRIGGVADPKVNCCIGAENLRYYRNKAVFAVGPHGEVGFKKAKSNYVLDIDDCMLQSDAAMVCADALREFLKNHGSASCGIEHMTVRTAFESGEVMVVLEAGGSFDAADAEALIMMLDDAVYSINNYEEGNLDGADTVFSLESVAIVDKGKCRILAGKPTIIERFNIQGAGSEGCEDGRTISYEISPQSFFQVNPEQMVRLYDKAAEYACPGVAGAGGTILDLYCGAGTIGIWLLDKLRAENEEAFNNTKVIGIESVKPAVLDANRNSVINGFTNTRYFCGKAEEELQARGIEKAEVVILDPPRAGCDEALLDAVCKAKPERLVYLSCDAGTLARDVKHLCASGYEFVETTAIDQFPLTSATESVSLLIKR